MPETDIHIVLVDNGKTQLAIIERMVRAMGYSDIRSFKSGEDAWAHISERKQVDLVVTGLELSGMSGLELCWQIRANEQTKFAYVIALTGSRDDKLFIEALDCGADDFLRKPVVHEILWARLRAAHRVIRLQRDLNHIANHDPLTNLLNRRAFAATTDYVIDSCNGPISLLLLDIDHFKSINDTHGHDVGDEALCALSATTSDFIPGDALLGRLGGEEFAILLPDMDAADAYNFAERLRIRISEIRVSVSNQIVSFTTSIGLAEFGGSIISLADAMKAADQGLYAAKEGGRNRVIQLETA